MVKSRGKGSKTRLHRRRIPQQHKHCLLYCQSLPHTAAVVHTYGFSAIADLRLV